MQLLFDFIESKSSSEFPYGDYGGQNKRDLRYFFEFFSVSFWGDIFFSISTLVSVLASISIFAVPVGYPISVLF